MSIQHFQTKLGITKYSIVTNSNDSVVTLRLMTEQTLRCSSEWLNSISYRRVVGEEARPTLADVQEQYLPSVLAQESVTPAYCNAEWRADWVCPVVRCSEAGTDVGRRNRSRSTRNRPATGECITTGQRLGTKLPELWLSCCSMIPRSPRSKRTRRRATCERSDATKAGFERQGTVTISDGSSRVHV